MGLLHRKTASRKLKCNRIPHLTPTWCKVFTGLPLSIRYPGLVHVKAEKLFPQSFCRSLWWNVTSGRFHQAQSNPSGRPRGQVCANVELFGSGHTEIRLSAFSHPVGWGRWRVTEHFTLHFVSNPKMTTLPTVCIQGKPRLPGRLPSNISCFDTKQLVYLIRYFLRNRSEHSSPMLHIKQPWGFRMSQLNTSIFFYVCLNAPWNIHCKPSNTHTSYSMINVFILWQKHRRVFLPLSLSEIIMISHSFWSISGEYHF